MAKIQVLVVDDSALMRRIITDVLQQNSGIQVVGTAKNGAEALQVIPHLNPDVVTLDVEMPVMDGLETLPKILKQYSLPVIMLSSLTTQGAEHTISALQMGAFDFIAKPSGSISLDLAKVGQELVQKVKTAALSKKAGTFRNVPKTNAPVPKAVPVRTVAKPALARKPMQALNAIIAIGTSTGGPRALQELLPRLPGNLKAAIVVVQHMPPGFTKSLANRLDSLSELTIEEAQDGQELLDGHVYIAPGDFHMEVKESAAKYRIVVQQEEEIGGHRPSVDVLFNSVAKLSSLPVVAVILTGMGSDGTKGMQRIKENGGKTIAEAEQSCVVYGMPKSAIQQGCVDSVVSLPQVAEEILRNLS